MTNRAEDLKRAMATIESAYAPRVDHRESTIGGVPTGSVGLDRNTACGGWPRGRVSEIWGEESSSKTTLLLHSMAEAQRAGGTVAFIDVEHALDVRYAQALGVDLDAALLFKPESGAQTFGIITELVKSDAVDLIVVDSVAAMISESEITGDGDEAAVAKLMASGLRPLIPALSRSKSALVFINQMRAAKRMCPQPDQSPWELRPTGGNALKFYCSVRAEISVVRKISIADEIIGSEVKIYLHKSKLGRPHTSATCRCFFGKGLYQAWEVARLAVELGVIERKGREFRFNGKTLAKDAKRLTRELSSSPELHQEIYQAILAVPVANVDVIDN